MLQVLTSKKIDVSSLFNTCYGYMFAQIYVKNDMKICISCCRMGGKGKECKSGRVACCLDAGWHKQSLTSELTVLFLFVLKKRFDPCFDFRSTYRIAETQHK